MEELIEPEIEHKTIEFKNYTVTKDVLIKP